MGEATQTIEPAESPSFSESPMDKLSPLCAAALATFLFATPAFAVSGDFAVTPDRLLIKLQRGDETVSDDEVVRRVSLQAGVPLAFERRSILGWSIVRVEGKKQLVGHKLAAVAEQVSAAAGVQSVEVDRILRPSVTPNDPQLDLQYAVEVLQLEQAWDITAGSSETVVAILDTGVVNHEDLQGAVVGGYDFVSDVFAANDGDGRDPNFTDPGDGADCGNGYFPSSFHGTMVSGVTAARFDNGVGVAGTAPNVSLTQIRVLGRCGGSFVDINEGAYWAAGFEVPGVPSNPNPAKVINLSLGGNGACDAFAQDVFTALDESGRIVIVAAGNEGEDTTSKVPVNCDGIIGVAASDHDNFLSSFSNFGDEVDIIAPGGDMNFYGVEEAGIRTTTGPGSNDYTFTEGTSFASPYVAGIAALMVSVDPSLTRSQVRTLLQSGGQVGFCPVGGGQFAECPRRIADASEALSALSLGEAPPPAETPPSNNTVTQTQLGCGDSVEGLADQQVVLSLELGSQTEVTLELTWNGSADLDLYLLDDQEQLLGASEQEETNVEGIQGELDAGQYIVLVNPYSGSATFVLSLECSVTADGDDGGDDGGSRSSRRSRGGCTLGSGSTPPLVACLLTLFLVFLTRRGRAED